MVRITDTLEVRDDELTFTASRSSGAGGQNVNKVSTKVTLLFDVGASPSLGAVEKSRIAERLATRINAAGVLRVTSQRHRTQAANREATVTRFAELLRAALHEGPQRRPTRVPFGVRKDRLIDKKRRGIRKQERARPDVSDE